MLLRAATIDAVYISEVPKSAASAMNTEQQSKKIKGCREEQRLWRISILSLRTSLNLSNAQKEAGRLSMKPLGSNMHVYDCGR